VPGTLIVPANDGGQKSTKVPGKSTWLISAILQLQKERLAHQEEIGVLRQENEQMRQQLTALAAELASLRERIGRNSRNSSKPPSSDSQGFKPA
jgi:hypothetical protein